MDSARLARETVLVTGARGFIGRHLVKRLLMLGVGLVVCTTRGPAAPTAPHMPTSPRTRWVATSLQGRGTMRQLLGEHGVTKVIHLATVASADASLETCKKVFDSCLTATGDLLMAAAEARPDARVILPGSLEATDPMGSPAVFGSPYGAAKAAAHVVAAAMRRFLGQDAVSVRIGMAYGPDDPNVRRLVPYTIQTLLAGGRVRLSSAMRPEDWVYIDDVVDALVAATFAEGRLPATLDIGSGRHITARDVVTNIHGRIGRGELGFGELPDRVGPPAGVADIESHRSATGWEPVVSLEEGLRRTIDWHDRDAAPPRARPA